MSYDPILKVFKKDYENVNRSNWNLDNKNRLSIDVGYLYPVAVYDVLPNTYFKLDINAVLSSNPTIAPILGSMKFRAEAFFVEKAAYVNKLRNNEKLSVDRNVPFPIVDLQGAGIISNPPGGTYKFSPATGILELLNMYPAGWSNSQWNLTTGTPANQLDSFPALNAIPLIMYYDIYRNYYLNVQDPNTPFRISNYVPDDDNTPYSLFEDSFVNREKFDQFINQCRSRYLAVEENFQSSFGIPLFPKYTKSGGEFQFPNHRDHLKYLHYGLLRRTYNNDFFTSFISNDNVSLMKTHSNIEVNNNMLSVEQISLANRNWRFAVRSLLWGTDWADYNAVHFGTKLKMRYGMPQFLGAISSDIIFQDVMNQAQGEGNTIKSELGGRASVAFGNVTNKTSDKKKYKPFVEFTTQEEGYVMVLLSLVPEVNYFQGVHPMYFKTNLSHSYSPEYNAYGMQDFHKAWASVFGFSHSSSQVFNYWRDYNTAIHKVPIWYEYMARYNELHGLFTLDNEYRYWTFARPFSKLDFYFGDLEGNSNYFYDSTYVLPELYNSQFAVAQGHDNYQVQISFDCFAKQLLDKQIIAYL